MPYSRITLLPSQQVIFVEEGETILDAALRAGLNLPHSCKGGHCSSCRARILRSINAEMKKATASTMIANGAVTSWIKPPASPPMRQATT